MLSTLVGHETLPEDHAALCGPLRVQGVKQRTASGSRLPRADWGGGLTGGRAGASSPPIGSLEPPPPVIGHCREGRRDGTRRGAHIRGGDEGGRGVEGFVLRVLWRAGGEQGPGLGSRRGPVQPVWKKVVRSSG